MTDNALKNDFTRSIDRAANVDAKWNNIESAKVKGFASVEDGKVKVNVESSGETITDFVDNIVLDYPVIQEIYNATLVCQNKALTVNYDGNIDLPTYQRVFNAYYDAGLVDMPIDKINSAYGALIPQVVRMGGNKE